MSEASVSSKELLVALTEGGEALVYQGTDPDNADTFGLKGIWNIGELRHGRTIAAEYGGDLLVLSRRGLVSLRHLLQGEESTSLSAAVSARIAPALQAVMASAARG